MDILEDSGAISRPFTDQVKQKLDEVNGNPADLIESLQCVPRFRQDKIEHLREYLTEKGYLNNEKPLSGDEIRVLLQAKISSLNMNPEEAQNFINGIIG